MLLIWRVGHISALEKIKNPGVYTYNLGTGHGYSVLDIVKTFERVNNLKINYEFTERRQGDLAEYFADPSKAEKELEWKAKKGIEDMCKDAWNFAKNI